MNSFSPAFDESFSAGVLSQSTAQQIRLACAAVFDIDEDVLTSPTRQRDVTRARMATCYVLKQSMPHLSHSVIGRIMGGFDHSTVINAIRQTESRLTHDADLAGKVFALVHRRDGARQHDAHVQQWRAYRRAKADLLAVRAANPPAFNSELDEFRKPDRLWCAQCDATVPIGAAAACKRQYCPLVAAPQQEVATS